MEQNETKQNKTFLVGDLRHSDSIKRKKKQQRWHSAVNNHSTYLAAFFCCWFFCFFFASFQIASLTPAKGSWVSWVKTWTRKQVLVYRVLLVCLTVMWAGERRLHTGLPKHQEFSLHWSWTTRCHTTGPYLLSSPTPPTPPEDPISSALHSLLHVGGGAATQAYLVAH